MQARRAVQQERRQLLAADPSLPSLPLSELNKRAATLLKGGNPAAAAAAYHILFAKAARQNLTHPELYVCHSNCAAAYLQLGLHEEALRQADACQRLAQASLRRWAAGAACCCYCCRCACACCPSACTWRMVCVVPRP